MLTMERAIRLAKLLIVHAQAAFDLMSNDPAIEDAKYILRWILDGKQLQFRQNKLHRTGRFSKSKIDRLKKALAVLQDRHIVSELQVENGRKPILAYHVNPAVFENAGAETEDK